MAARDKEITRLRQRAHVMHAQLAHAHKTLISIADKYMALKKRRNVQVPIPTLVTFFSFHEVEAVTKIVDSLIVTAD